MTDIIEVIQTKLSDNSLTDKMLFIVVLLLDILLKWY